MDTLAHRELRNRSGAVLRDAEAGHQFVVTVDGRPVAQLGPCRNRRWISRPALLAVAGKGAPDTDALVDLGFDVSNADAVRARGPS